MAKSNRDRVGDVMDALKVGLAPYVIREYKMVYKREFGREIDTTLVSGAYELPRDAFADEKSLMEAVDTAGWLKLMFHRWKEVFQSKMGHSERSYVSELMEARNAWAYQKTFTNEDAYRVADTATRLLQAISAGEQSGVTQAIGNELLRLRFEAEADKAKKKTGSLDKGELTTRPGLQPWRLVVQPHPDVASGRYVQAEFAADLAQVRKGTAQPEYLNPVEFFRRTYLTQGLLDLLGTGVRRLWGQGGDPVVQLQTSFGGGKTHSMLALYHLMGGTVQLSDIVGGEHIQEVSGYADLPVANRAVLVGTDFNPATPRRYPDVTTHTLWGEMAYQLGGIDGYAFVQDADLKGVNPGADTLVALLEQFGPALIIIDELVAFARNLYGVSGLPAGSFDAVMSFTQSLTEAVKRSTDSMLLVSVPQSDIEIGGEGGQLAREILGNTIGRLESVWKPVTPTESFEIVRRRLFATEVDYAARDAVLGAFIEMYRSNNREFPSGVSEGDYLLRMKSAYPIHPELFDRLYQDWSTLERFQRTRGVLRLMAAVIHALWSREDQSLLIMPGTIPLDVDTVRNEMLRYLPEGWSAIVDTDIDGVRSRPYAIDGEVPALGRYAASRRVARSIFVGSAPSVVGQSVRGVDEPNIRLATVQPGEPLTGFGDALKRMGNQLTYMYGDGSRYWFDTRPTVNKIARDRAQSLPIGDIEHEISNRLKKVRNSTDMFSGVHVDPMGTGDIVDEPRARVVVLGSAYTHKRNVDDSEAMKTIRAIWEMRGNSPRIYRNMLLFIAADQTEYEALDKAVRDYLAWKSIEQEEEHLNLDAQMRKQVRSSLTRADETVELRLQAAYSWLIVPAQPDANQNFIEWQTHRITGDDNFYVRAARKLKQSEILITQWSPYMLRTELDNYLWKAEDAHIGLRQLWEYLATYCFLPRLRDHNVLVDAVHAGIGMLDAPFAYAANVTQDGYEGLAYRSLSSIYFDGNSVIVRPEIAQEWINRIDPPIIDGGTDGDDDSTGDDGSDDGDDRVTPPPKVGRYYGAVYLDAQRLNREIGQIVDEVVQHLTSLAGCEVEVRLEITARKRDGFDETTLRTLSENSRTLKFNDFGFEPE